MVLPTIPLILVYNLNLTHWNCKRKSQSDKKKYWSQQIWLMYPECISTALHWTPKSYTSYTRMQIVYSTSRPISSDNTEQSQQHIRVTTATTNDVHLKSTIYLHQSRSKTLEKLGNAASNHAVNPKHAQEAHAPAFHNFQRDRSRLLLPGFVSTKAFRRIFKINK